jgi:cytochrome c553
MIGMSTAPKRPPLVHALVLTVALCPALVCPTTTLASDDIGKKKADEACAACHGPEGNKPITPETPRLAGQQYDYLVQALTEYRKGTRDNAVMSAMVKPLTQKQVRDLAGYFSRQQGLVTKR